MTLRTVIADDEPLARERLKRLIASNGDLQIVGECRNGADVLETLRACEVDLLLLDIRMPGLSGLDAVRQMRGQKLPMIIFITAHDSYAVHAFEIHAVDYLVKPVDAERFQEAINRAKERGQMQTALATQHKFASALTTLDSLASKGEIAYVTRLIVHSGTKDLIIRVSDISWVEAADYYVSLHVADKKHLMRESMKKLETVLDPRRFIRIHRSAVINIDCVREVHREGRSDGWVLLSNGDRVRMSSAGWHKLLSASGGC